MEIEPRRLKIEHISDKKAQRDETTHLGRAHTAQPHGNPSKGCWEVHRPRWRCGCMKIASVNVKIKRINVNQTLKAEKAHLERASAVQPLGNAPKRLYRVHRPRRRRGRIKTVPRNVSRTREGGRTYLGRANAIRSIWRPKRQIRRLNKLTFESRMPGELWRDDGEYG